MKTNQKRAVFNFTDIAKFTVRRGIRNAFLVPYRIYTLISISFLCIVYVSCKKESATDLHEKYSKKVIAWLQNQKNETPNNVVQIDFLQEHLQFKNSREENAFGNEKLLIIPISEEFKNQMHITANIDANLLLFINRSGEIRKGHMVLYKPENGLQTRVPENAFYNITTTAKNVPDGQYIFCTLTGTRNYQIRYDDGILREQGLVQKKQREESTVRANSTKRAFGMCYLVYLVTTYYNEFGEVTGTSEQFLYSYGNCGGSAPAEPQIPQPGDSGGGGETEYQVENAKIRYAVWMVDWVNDSARIFAFEDYTGKDGKIIWVSPKGSGLGRAASNMTYKQTSHTGGVDPGQLSASANLQATVTYAERPFSPDLYNKNHTFTYTELFP